MKLSTNNTLQPPPFFSLIADRDSLAVGSMLHEARTVESLEGYGLRKQRTTLGLEQKSIKATKNYSQDIVSPYLLRAVQERELVQSTNFASEPRWNSSFPSQVV